MTLITLDFNQSIGIVALGTMDDRGQGWWKVEHDVFCNNRSAWVPEMKDTIKWDAMPVSG